MTKISKKELSELSPSRDYYYDGHLHKRYRGFTSSVPRHFICECKEGRILLADKKCYKCGKRGENYKEKILS